LVSDWYYAYYRARGNMFQLTLDQIASYEARSQNQHRAWSDSSSRQKAAQ
jgi:hypothetical protein